MKSGDLNSTALPVQACGDEGALRRFVEERISVNAWPIWSPKLLRLIRREGVDLEAAGHFSMSLAAMAEMMRMIHGRAVRVERMLRIDNAFHTPAHNAEVLLRLLCLEWPAEKPMPDFVRMAPLHLYPTIEALHAVVLDVLAALQSEGVSPRVLVRDLLAALGHDFGHSGGTDRLYSDGTPAHLTHEEVAEKYVGNIGVELGLPSALILESMAGIRATTFYSRPGRQRVVPSNDFERKLTLADVMGCVLPSVDWLTHVGVPVLKEKIPFWKRRIAEIAAESKGLRAQIDKLPVGDQERMRKEDALTVLLAEDSRIIRDLEEWFKSEQGFFRYLLEHKLSPVPNAEGLWGPILREKIALMDRLLLHKAVYRPLSEQGFGFLEAYADLLANAVNLKGVLERGELHPALCETLRLFYGEDGKQGTP